MYIANKRILVKTQTGEHVFREKGDPIPEAETWNNLNVWLQAGHIVELSDEESVSDDSQSNDDTESSLGNKKQRRRN